MSTLSRWRSLAPCTSPVSWLVLIASILPLYAWAQDVGPAVSVEGLGDLGHLGVTGVAVFLLAKILGLLDRWTSLADRGVKLAEDIWSEAKAGKVQVGIGRGDR